MKGEREDGGREEGRREEDKKEGGGRMREGGEGKG